jgi:hypothetical protein
MSSLNFRIEQAFGCISKATVGHRLVELIAMIHTLQLTQIQVNPDGETKETLKE